MAALTYRDSDDERADKARRNVCWLNIQDR